MELGLFSLMPLRDTSRAPAAIYEDTIGLVKDAEAGGFDVAWFAEHHFGNYSMCPSPLMMAGYCAGVTNTIGLGAAVLVTPLYHPMRVIQELGMVDILSGGRAVIGLGSGYQGYEFDRYGVDLKANWAITHEFMDILEMALDTSQVTYEGKHFHIPETPIGVRMVQEQPRVYIAGNEAAYLARSARRGYTPIATVGGQPVEVMLKVKQHVTEQFARAGWQGADIPFGMQRSVFVTDDPAEALYAAEQSLYTARLVMAFRGNYEKLEGFELLPQPYEGEPTPEQIMNILPMGNAETCAERIVAELKAVRPTHYSCFMQSGGLEGAACRRSMERFVRDVLPMVEAEVGDLKAFGPDIGQMAAQ